MEKVKYLIIGNSAGGIGGAEAIRQIDEDGSVTIVSAESYPAYSRVRISEHLACGCPLEDILFRPADFYKANGIRFIPGRKAERLDAVSHIIKLDDGAEIKWQKLLLATGGLPILPPIKGLNKEGVFSFTNLSDAIEINKYLGDTEEAVVIGGGLIGVSATEALVKRGIKVTVIEMKERILNTILDEEASAMEAAAMRQAGVEILTGNTVAEVNSNPSKPQSVSGVTLNDGRLIPCRLVIVAIGVTPRTELAVSGGVKMNRGILVDNYMTTSQPDIYACGDVAETYDFVYGENRLNPIWPNAYLGGRVAGFNMAGVPTAYQGSTVMNTMKYFGVDIVSAGITVPPDDSYRVFSQKNGSIYHKVVIKDNCIAGMVFAGDIEKSGIIFNLIIERVDVSQFYELLATDDFGLTCLPEGIWRPRLTIPAGIAVEV
ncbi:MAG: FAD-dependent oxidoreductase [Chloroflexota bacterium]